ncbi:MAG: GNVR domain-containing protein [Terriglobia bacterium]|nr:GNVR domain-containing protein [Terriglobia bacterium]
MQDTLEKSEERLEPLELSGAVDFLDVLLVLTRARKRIAWIVGGAAVLSVLLVLLLPRYYKGKTTLLPPQSNQQSANLLAGQLTALAGISPRDLGIKNQNDLYVGLLKSDTVANALIQRFQLQQVYKKRRLVDARTRLAKLSDISSGKDGLINITVDDRDPKRAAALANGYVEELQRLSQELALTEAGQRRLFFEQQIRKCRQDLDAAEVALAETQRRTGVIDIEANAKVLLEQIGIVRGQLAAKEAEAQSMRAFAAKGNPDLRFAEEQAAALRVQLAKLERGAGDGESGSTGKLSAGAVEYASKWREVKYQQTLFELLSAQYESARLDEAREGTVFQVVDSAAPPEKPSRPPRLLIVAASIVFFGFCAVLGTVLQDSRKRAFNDPVRSGKLEELQNSWRLRR